MSASKSSANVDSKPAGMSMLWKVFIGIVVIVLVMVGGAYLLPSRIRVERTTSIHAPPERIYEKVATLKTWKDWTAWNPTDYPEMKWTYEGPEAGVGAESRWQDPKAGNGHMKITKADPQKGIEYDLTFEGIPPIPGSIAFSPDGDGTKVVWFFEDNVGWNPVNRYFCFFAMDSMIGGDFEKGLAGLKKAVETDSPEEKPMEKPPEDKPAEAGAPTPAPAKQD